MRFLFALPIALTLTCVLAQEMEPADPAVQAPKPKHPAFKPIEDDPALPRVLLIGDSISIGYTIPTRKLLNGIANVHRAPENCGDTAFGLKRLDGWLGNTRWDVIHFNFGLHDLKYLDAKGNYVAPDKGKQVAPLADYERQLRAIIARLKATGSQIIFATTTPVPKGAMGRVEGDEIEYNRAAVAIMQSENVPVNDLHAGITTQIPTHPEGEIQEPRNVHFTPLGYRMLAELTAEAVREKL